MFEEESSHRLFDTNFIDSVNRVSECSQISENLPFRYVSKMYDSTMSSRGSALGKDSLMKAEMSHDEFKKPK